MKILSGPWNESQGMQEISCLVSFITLLSSWVLLSTYRGHSQQPLVLNILFFLYQLKVMKEFGNITVRIHCWYICFLGYYCQHFPLQNLVNIVLFHVQMILTAHNKSQRSSNSSCNNCSLFQGSKPYTGTINTPQNQKCLQQVIGLLPYPKCFKELGHQSR